MSDMGDMIGMGVKIAGAFALAAAVVIGGVAYVGYQHHEEKETSEMLGTRATDTLSAKNLTVITMDKFSKDATCDSEHPYGANFTAKNAAGKAVDGHICSAPDRESVVTLKP